MILRKNQIINYNELTIECVLLLYMLYMLEKPLYISTLILLNVYHENCLYKGNSGKDEKGGNYLSISHRYGSHGGPNVRGDVCQFNLTSQSHSKEYAWRTMGNLIASNIWKYMFKIL